MKRSNQLFIVTLALAASCAKKSPETLLSRWELKNEKAVVVERALASAPQGQCLKDIFSVDVLKDEMKELEMKYAGAPKVTGKWKHLDLSKLPVPQANFLKTYGSEIGDLNNPDAIDYSTCSDVPCIFNKIYGKESHVAGYVHYIWYLKFGHMLSADNSVPPEWNEPKKIGIYNGKPFAVSQYLYNDKELYGLWRLSLMLKTPHTTLGYLKEIQRIPRGEGFEGKDMAGVCGLAYSGGWIRLQDGCLSIYSSPDQGYLYQAVAHEISHHVDFEQGRGSKTFYRSHKQDYLDLSGFFLNEYVDANGKQIRQWSLKEGSKLPTSYAGTAPQENFAESLSVFRTDGDTAKLNMKEDHFNFVSKNYYQDRAFNKEALLTAWLSKNAPETGKAAFKAVVDCSKESGPEKSTFFKATDFSAPVLPGMLNCLGVKSAAIADSLRARIMMYEPEGCSTFTGWNGVSKWDGLVKSNIASFINGYLVELQKDKEYLKRIQDYYAQVQDKRIAREAYLNCYGESDEKKCYDDEIMKGALEAASNLKLPADQTQEMADMYASYHSYESLKDEAKTTYSSLISSHQDLVRDETRKLWDSCRNLAPDDEANPSGSIFQISEGYMVSSLYNCLNAQAPEAMKEVVRNLSVDGFKLQHPKEEIILLKEIQPQFVSMISERYKADREKEIRKGKEVELADKGLIRSQLLSDFSWVKSVVDTDQILLNCRDEALKRMPYFPLFHTRKQLFGDYVEKNTCFNITAAEQFNKWLSDSKGEFLDKVGAGLEEKLLTAGVARAQECLGKFPVDNALNRIKYRKEREACLIDEWPKLESKVLEAALKDPLVIKFQMPVESLRMKIEGNRRRLQIRIIKENFN